MKQIKVKDLVFMSAVFLMLLFFKSDFENNPSTITTDKKEILQPEVPVNIDDSVLVQK